MIHLDDGIDGRILRKRRGIWPDVLAPAGNTFAASGHYGVQSYIAYPETGIAYNPNFPGWNPYWQGYYQQNQFNTYNPYGYNQPYLYGSGQGIPYEGLGMNNVFPYSSPQLYNGYYPSGTGNPWYPPRSNFGRPLRSGAIRPRTASNIGRASSVQRINIPASPPNNPTNK
ncbi:unnamed protein product [Rotaria sordida]|uniref:Uncharacterized protein n=1 Tax=Rotaria sordida TaxID=392033 RepID=A0A815FBF1_9BILA|nr:unnamed protein product [Rotaria sordida]CAF1286839.1 unnamed protein product [Rotaria sordida]CAF1323005.1 unnamed protein product [Rotaria sordida]CAF3573359.1 unnamed protein product [Rotaria sordida]CAF3813163.1 unnamed protein product [Rotaria sordida]